MELGLEARPRPRSRVEEEDEPGTGGLDPRGELLAAELKVVVVVLVLLLLAADVDLEREIRDMLGLMLEVDDVGVKCQVQNDANIGCFWPIIYERERVTIIWLTTQSPQKLLLHFSGS